MRAWLTCTLVLTLPSVALATPVQITQLTSSVQLQIDLSNRQRIQTSSQVLLAQHVGPALASSLTLSSVVRDREGHAILKFKRTHLGLDVHHQGATVVVDPQGTPRLIARQLDDTLPSSLPITSLNIHEASDLALPLVANAPGTVVARQVWADAPTGPFLAWQVQVIRPVRPSAPVVLIDAQTGTIRRVFNTIRFDRQTRVYQYNPIATPSPIQVTLNVPPNASVLGNDLIDPYNCIDRRSVRRVGERNVHVCDLEKSVVADIAGDYPTTIGNGTELEDPYAELSVFYHANEAAQAVQKHLPGFRVQDAPLTVVANYREAAGLSVGDWMRASNPDIPLERYSNAFFSSEGLFYNQAHAIEGMALFHGQGTFDLGYDGDVVYHEFGHAVTHALLDLDGTPIVDDRGSLYDPGAMDEGFADYLSSTITGDPRVGEYAAIEFGIEEIRDISLLQTCPQYIAGQRHNDSIIFSGALWSARTALSTDDERNALDAAVLKGLQASPSGSVSYDTVAELILSQLELASQPSVAERLRNAFVSRGVLPRCERILSAQSGIFVEQPSVRLWTIPGAVSTGTTGLSPGVVQFQLDLPANANQLVVNFFSFHDPWGNFLDFEGILRQFAPTILVRYDAPISYTYQPSTILPEDVQQERVQVGVAEAAFEVPPGARTAYVSVGNRGDIDGGISQVILTTRSNTGGTGGVGGTGGTGGSGGIGGSAGQAGAGGDAGTAGTAGSGGTGGAGGTGGLAGEAGAAGEAETFRLPSARQEPWEGVNDYSCTAAPTRASSSTPWWWIASALGLFSRRRSSKNDQ